MAKLDLGRTYPLANPFALGGRRRAMPTGEFRKPKKGEWYLSGAIVEVYQAPNNLTIEFYIAKLV